MIQEILDHSRQNWTLGKSGYIAGTRTPQGRRYNSRIPPPAADVAAPATARLNVSLRHDFRGESARNKLTLISVSMGMYTLNVANTLLHFSPTPNDDYCPPDRANARSAFSLRGILGRFEERAEERERSGTHVRDPHVIGTAHE